MDTPGHLYSYTFSGGDWEKFFPLQHEVEGYFRRVAKETGVEDEVRFGTECLVARYGEESRVWVSTLRLPDGSEETLVADVVITAVGAFTTPKWPPIAGLRDFDGPVIHTSQWDPSVELAGRHVAVIGNGASAMQLVPAIADTVGTLTVFQRSRQWAAPFPKFHKPVPEPVRLLFREVPHYEWLYQTVTVICRFSCAPRDSRYRCKEAGARARRHRSCLRRSGPRDAPRDGLIVHRVTSRWPTPGRF